MMNLTGNAYGRWLVLQYDYTDARSRHYWKCRCVCGREYVVRSDRLKRGTSKSCLYCRSIPASGKGIVNGYTEYAGYIECVVRNGDSFIFDKADYDRVKKHTWYICKTNKTVMTRLNKKIINLSRILMEPGAGCVVDHINHNPRDNRRVNLRVCTQHENSMNCSKPINNTSGYKGISWSAKRKAWQVYVKADYKHIYVGSYKLKKEAARAYNRAAETLFGEHACLNEI